MNKKKRMWTYIIVIAVVILGYILINNTKNPETITNNNPLNNNASSNNTIPSVPGNSNLTKNNYTAPYSLDWQTSSLDDPNDFVFMFITGNYNTINVSSRTEVIRVTFTGTGNKVAFCTGNYPQPEVVKVGINNQVSYVIC